MIVRLVDDVECQKAVSVAEKMAAVEKDLTIPSLFHRAVCQYRDKPAVYAGTHMLTFGQLDELSGRIACGLRCLGVEKGDNVVFLLKCDYRLIPVILGISRAGAVFIPADPTYPKERISYMMKDSHAVMLISSADVENAKDYNYTEVDKLMCMENEPAVLPEIRQEDSAYMIYTSWTRGWSKGVISSHRGIASIVHPDNISFNRDIGKNCRGIVSGSSVCLGISLFDIFAPLMNGMFVELDSIS